MADGHLSNQYFAGLFDGEGWFSINRTMLYGRRYTYSAHATLALRQEEVVRLLAIRFGGTVMRKEGRKANHNPSFAWQVSGANALVFALAVQPYLLIKGPQAAALVRFQQSRGKPSLPLPEKTYLLYEELYQRMKLLNRRGVIVANGRRAP